MIKDTNAIDAVTEEVTDRELKRDVRKSREAYIHQLVVYLDKTMGGKDLVWRGGNEIKRQLEDRIGTYQELLTKVWDKNWVKLYSKLPPIEMMHVGVGIGKIYQDMPATDELIKRKDIKILCNYLTDKYIGLSCEVAIVLAEELVILAANIDAFHNGKNGKVKVTEIRTQKQNSETELRNKGI